MSEKTEESLCLKDTWVANEHVGGGGGWIPVTVKEVSVQLNHKVIALKCGRGCWATGLSLTKRECLHGLCGALKGRGNFWSSGWSPVHVGRQKTLALMAATAAAAEWMPSLAGKKQRGRQYCFFLASPHSWVNWVRVSSSANPFWKHLHRQAHGCNS